MLSFITKKNIRRIREITIFTAVCLIWLHPVVYNISSVLSSGTGSYYILLPSPFHTLHWATITTAGWDQWMLSAEKKLVTTFFSQRSPFQTWRRICTNVGRTRARTVYPYNIFLHALELEVLRVTLLPLREHWDNIQRPRQVRCGSSCGWCVVCRCFDCINAVSVKVGSVKPG